MTDPILDTARELLAHMDDGVSIMVSLPPSDKPPHIEIDLASLCRALIARTEALRECDTALHDWFATYAADMAGADEVLKAYTRISAAGGTIAYIAKMREAARAALR